ncbi:uncharacterized protein LOC135124431 [Zophobas morio]|uniref:uncharacterized protein LOC135124431 n=1 Tax=Zophobas morio TaxID=2755281 RepID=UPI003083888A
MNFLVTTLKICVFLIFLSAFVSSSPLPDPRGGGGHGGGGHGGGGHGGGGHGGFGHGGVGHGGFGHGGFGHGGFGHGGFGRGGFGRGFIGGGGFAFPPYFHRRRNYRRFRPYWALGFGS